MKIEGLTIGPTHKCFDDALDELARLVKAGSAKGMLLVHGICTSPAGELYAHAWLERGDEAIDFGIVVTGPNKGARCMYTVEIESYYTELKIVETIKYTPLHAWSENNKHGHYGPWEHKYRALCAKKGKNRTFRGIEATASRAEL